jgi:hypothetical protein
MEDSPGILAQQPESEMVDPIELDMASVPPLPELSATVASIGRHQERQDIPDEDLAEVTSVVSKTESAVPDTAVVNLLPVFSHGPLEPSRASTLFTVEFPPQVIPPMVSDPDCADVMVEAKEDLSQQGLAAAEARANAWKNAATDAEGVASSLAAAVAEAAPEKWNTLRDDFDAFGARYASAVAAALAAGVQEQPQPDPLLGLEIACERKSWQAELLLLQSNSGVQSSSKQRSMHSD